MPAVMMHLLYAQPREGPAVSAAGTLSSQMGGRSVQALRGKQSMGRVGGLCSWGRPGPR